MSQNNVPKEHKVHRVGDWLPQDHRVHRDWLSGVVKHVEKNPTELHPVLKEFQHLIESNTRIYLLFNAMFEEIPRKKPYGDDPTGLHKQVHGYKHMLKLFNHILHTAPGWNDTSAKVGMVGTPINAILDWPMGTPSGFTAFQDPEVNQMMKKVLNAWGEYLASPESAEVLGDDQYGWFGPHGRKQLETVANVGVTNHTFEDMFVSDPKAKNHGFKSWDDFFTRPFKEEARPIPSPEDDSIISNACESRPYNVATDVKARDKFWNKGQPYSVYDMLAHDEFAEQFVGGTVYQAFLSALSYHRWHSPVAGKVVKAYVVPGTYYSEPLFEGIGDPDSKGIDMKGECTSQGYLTATATRAIIFIEADNKDIGLMAFLGIGMTEVSTCDITVKEGQHLNRGDSTGRFHFGGSSHCLMFRKGVKLSGWPELHKEENVPVRSQIARVITS